jgi:ribonuclease Z
MKRFAVLIILVTAVVTAGWALLSTAPVEAWLFRRIAFDTLSKAPPTLARKDQLSVLFCGTGSPLPDKNRGGPCTLVAAGDRYYLVDAGLDSARNLMLWRVPLQNIQGVLVTHFHSDHIAELGEMRLQTWVAGRSHPLAVYGPPGVERVVNGFNEAYAIDAGYRTAHHGARMLPPDAVAMAPHAVQPGVILDRDGLRITAFAVHHDPATPAYGYRFDYRGRSIVVSGDTAPTPNLVRAAQGADILIHEGLSPEMVGVMHDALEAAHKPRQAKIFHDIPGYHTAPVDAAREANGAQVRLLVFTHLIPILPNRFAEHLFLRGVSEVRPDGVRMAHDGLLLRLDGDRIDETDLD